MCSVFRWEKWIVFPSGGIMCVFGAVYPVRRVDGVWQFLCKFFHPISRFLLPLLEELKGVEKNTRIGNSTEKNKMRYNFHMNLYGTWIYYDFVPPRLTLAAFRRCRSGWRAEKSWNYFCKKRVAREARAPRERVMFILDENKFEILRKHIFPGEALVNFNRASEQIKISIILTLPRGLCAMLKLFTPLHSCKRITTVFNHRRQQ